MVVTHNRVILCFLDTEYRHRKKPLSEFWQQKKPGVFTLSAWCYALQNYLIFLYLSDRI